MQGSVALSYQRNKSKARPFSMHSPYIDYPVDFVLGLSNREVFNVSHAANGLYPGLRSGKAS
jgi:hypothetical protein